jgi:hypothetical protein
MTPQQYIQALNDLQKPLVVQQKRVEAVGKKCGCGSWQYKQEFAKECQIINALYPYEMKLLFEFMTSCYREKIKKKGKESVLAEIIKEGKACIPEYKDGWRSVYQQIKSLP